MKLNFFLLSDDEDLFVFEYINRTELDLVLDLSVLHTFLNQIQQKNLISNPPIWLQIFLTKLTLNTFRARPGELQNER